MPAFDIVSQAPKHELTNAVDQANRELGNRFDFRGTQARFELQEWVVTATAPSEFQLQQMLDILRARLAARGIDSRCMEIGDPLVNLAGARQTVTIKQGIDAVLAKQIIASVKAEKIKVDTQIQGDKLRISGKKRDDLQQVIALLRQQDFGLPLQFENFRD